MAKITSIVLLISMILSGATVTLPADVVTTYYEVTDGISSIRLPQVNTDINANINWHIRENTYDRYEPTFKAIENGTYTGDLIWNVDYFTSEIVNGCIVIVIEIITDSTIYHTFYYDVENDKQLDYNEYLKRFGYSEVEFMDTFEKVAEPGFTPEYWVTLYYKYVDENSIYALGWEYIDWFMFDNHGNITVQYHTTDKNMNAIQVTMPIENNLRGDIMRLHDKAIETYYLLTGLTTPVFDTEYRGSAYGTEYNGTYYAKVDDSRFSNMAELEAYFLERFTPELTEYYIETYIDYLFVEIDGRLYWRDGARGSSGYSNPYYYLTEVDEETMVWIERYDNVSYASRDLNNDCPDDYVPEYIYYEYELKLVNGEWRFNTFPCEW